ncbi:hypothetical protein BDZ45DRAFT_747277 [Acephala macrosclerotiorum]|nr:hypothetical protein BDZ45DRAFT_747277 [Acephala macrosclerotiorum]
MSPPHPFCCDAAIPYTVRHLHQILPPETKHSPSTKPLSPGPLVTSFILFVLKKDMSIAGARAQAPVLDGFINQTVAPAKAVLAYRNPPVPAETFRESKGRHHKQNLKSDGSSESGNPAFITQSDAPATAKANLEVPTILDEYVEVSESSPSEPSPYLKKHYALLELKCSYPILATGHTMGVIYDSTRFFAACEPKNSNEKTVLAPDTKVKGRISEFEFNSDRKGWSSGFPSWKMAGEEMEGDGVERFWCEVHKCWWEMRVWVLD